MACNLNVGAAAFSHTLHPSPQVSSFFVGGGAPKQKLTVGTILFGKKDCAQLNFSQLSVSYDLILLQQMTTNVETRLAGDSYHQT
jgi:hypothetical protein